MSLSYQAIYPRVRNAIHKSLNERVPIDEIRANGILENAPFRYSPEGVRALRGFILTEFEDVNLSITDSKFRTVKTVRAIAVIVYEALGGE